MTPVGSRRNSSRRVAPLNVTSVKILPGATFILNDSAAPALTTIVDRRASVDVGVGDDPVVEPVTNATSAKSDTPTVTSPSKAARILGNDTDNTSLPGTPLKSILRPAPSFAPLSSQPQSRRQSWNNSTTNASTDDASGPFGTNVLIKHLALRPHLSLDVNSLKSSSKPASPAQTPSCTSATRFSFAASPAAGDNSITPQPAPPSMIPPRRYKPMHSRIARSLDYFLNLIMLTFTFPWCMIPVLVHHCMDLEHRLLRLVEALALFIGGAGNVTLIIVLLRIHALDGSVSYQSLEVSYIVFCASFTLLALCHYAIYELHGQDSAKAYDRKLLHIFAIELDDLHIDSNSIQSLSWVYVLVSFVPALIAALLANWFLFDGIYTLQCSPTIATQRESTLCTSDKGVCCHVVSNNYDINSFIGVLAGNVATGYLFVQRVAIFILQHNHQQPATADTPAEMKLDIGVKDLPDLADMSGLHIHTAATDGHAIPVPSDHPHSGGVVRRIAEPTSPQTVAG